MLILGLPELTAGTQCHTRQTGHSTHNANAENHLSYLQRTRLSADASQCCSINFNGATTDLRVGTSILNPAVF